MRQIYIYKLPLLEAYSFSLIYEGYPRPDEIDEEASIHQVIVYDDKERPLKIENYTEGLLACSKSFVYDGELLVHEVEYLVETQGQNEVRIMLTATGFIREFWVGSELSYKEIYEKNSAGIIVACETVDKAGQRLNLWKANAKGDVIYQLGEKGAMEISYQYDDNDRPVEIVRRSSAGEEVSRLSYDGSRLVKEEIWQDGSCIQVEEHEYAADGEEKAYRVFVGGSLVLERLLQRDISRRWLVKLQKIRPWAKGHVMPKTCFQSSRVELLFDQDQHITDALTCGTVYQDMATGIYLDCNAYYFCEAE